MARPGAVVCSIGLYEASHVGKYTSNWIIFILIGEFVYVYVQASNEEEWSRQQINISSRNLIRISEFICYRSDSVSKYHSRGNVSARVFRFNEIYSLWDI